MGSQRASSVPRYATLRPQAPYSHSVPLISPPMLPYTRRGSRGIAAHYHGSSTTCRDYLVYTVPREMPTYLPGCPPRTVMVCPHCNV